MPFPHVETPAFEVRPALVIGAPVGPDRALVWAMMITSAGNRGWPGDIALFDDHLDLGLPRPSWLRTAKIATLEMRGASRVGRLDSDRLALVWTMLRTTLAL